MARLVVGLRVVGRRRDGVEVLGRGRKEQRKREMNILEAGGK